MWHLLVQMISMQLKKTDTWSNPCHQMVGDIQMYRSTVLLKTQWMSRTSLLALMPSYIWRNNAWIFQETCERTLTNHHLLLGILGRERYFMMYSIPGDRHLTPCQQDCICWEDYFWVTVNNLGVCEWWATEYREKESHQPCITKRGDMLVFTDCLQAKALVSVDCFTLYFVWCWAQ